MSARVRRRYARPESALINRNVGASSGRTSLRLEEEFWLALQDECERRRLTASEMVREIERALPGLPRTSAVRVWLLTRMRERAETVDRAPAAERADAVPLPHALGVAPCPPPIPA